MKIRVLLVAAALSGSLAIAASADDAPAIPMQSNGSGLRQGSATQPPINGSNTTTGVANGSNNPNGSGARTGSGNSNGSAGAGSNGGRGTTSGAGGTGSTGNAGTGGTGNTGTGGTGNSQPAKPPAPTK